MLFNEGKIGNIKLKNRFVMLPTVTNLSNNGFVSDEELEYYNRRSKDVSLVIVEASYVNKIGKFFVNQLGIDNDDKIDGLKKMVDLLHKNGAKAGIQLAMHNPNYKPSDFTKVQMVNFVKDFSSAAVRAKNAGFDLIELHFAHGWFVNQFLSPNVNTRNDEYGVSFEGRSKFAIDILKEIKKQLPNFDVICRINARDFTDGGFEIEESIKFAKLLERYGADALDISAGVGSTSEYHISPIGIPDKPLLELLKKIKENVNVPIIAANKLGFASDWEEILNNKAADFIGLARGLISDPDCIEKLKNGNNDDIRYCIHCNQACIANILKDLPVSCIFNPQVGREKIFEVKTDKPLYIAVIGGGPAGMTAAKYLAKKGHNVELYEKSNKLGGQLNVAKVPPYKDEIGRIVEYLESDLKKYDIKIHLNKNITLNDLKEMTHDKIVIATGSKPKKLNLEMDIKSYNAIDVLYGNLPKGNNIAVIGGGLTGLETAEYLAEKGKTVTIFEAKDEVGKGIFSMTRKLLLNRLKKLNINIFTKTIIKEVSEGKILFSINNEYKILKVDDIITAIGNLPDKELEDLINNDKYYFVGDCKKVASAVEAIRDGAQLSLLI